jgi:hypothetical protein
MSVPQAARTVGSEAQRRVPRAGGAASSLVAMRSAPVYLAAIVAVSTFVRAGIGRTVASVWILPDEIVYSELAKSIAAGGRPAIRGVDVFGWGEVYPTLIAPAWALFDDPVRAYHVALGINALVMSLAAIPAYLLARMFVSQGSALLVALFAVLVPSMSYTGVVMTENAAYPVFLLSVLFIARAVRRPTAVNQVLAVLGLVLVAFTRIQGLALVGGYLCAVLIYGLLAPRSERGRYLRRFVPSAVVVLAGSLAPAVVSTIVGDGPFAWLGARSSTFAEFHAREVPTWLIYLAADVVLYVAVIPVAATVVLIARGLSRQASEETRLFAAIALPTVAATLTSVSMVSASLDVDGRENLNERYVFYVVPLLFLGLALWIREQLPRRKPWATSVIAACCLLVVVLPIERLGYNAEFQSLALLPWLRLSFDPVVVAACAGLFAAAAGGLWLTCRSGKAGRLWLTVALWMSFLGVVALAQQNHLAKYFANAYAGARPDWVDGSVAKGANVAVVWDQRTAPHGVPDFSYYWLAVTEFFNATVGDVYSIGGRTYYDTFLPTIPVHVTADGTLAKENGRLVRAEYVLGTCRSPVSGRAVADASNGAVRLVEVRGTIRVSGKNVCHRPGS